VILGDLTVEPGAGSETLAQPARRASLEVAHFGTGPSEHPANLAESSSRSCSYSQCGRFGAIPGLAELNRQRRKVRGRGPSEQEQDEIVHITFQLEKRNF
jgi:hypothetical protein